MGDNIDFIFNYPTQILRLADGNTPSISKVYPRMYMLQQLLSAMSGDQDAIEEVQAARTAAYYAQKRATLATGSPGSRTRGKRAAVEAELDPLDDDVLQDLLYIPSIEPDLGQQIVGMLVYRWDMLHTSRHAAAYVLDPEWHSHLKVGWGYSYR